MSSSSLEKCSSRLNTKRKHSTSPTCEENGSLISGRKKYNVINEDVRKKIIQKLTEEGGNIKEVAGEYGLKLSTCKAILQVYQKEGRIGKKATRDRKSKIVSTILVARIDPMNPSTSTLIPYIHISEAKTASKKGDDCAQSELIKEAFKNAQEHIRSVIHQNASEIFLGNKVPNSSKKDLESAFLEAQRDAIKNLLKENPIQDSQGDESLIQPLKMPEKENSNGQQLSNGACTTSTINYNNIQNPNNSNIKTRRRNNNSSNVINNGSSIIINSTNNNSINNSNNQDACQQFQNGMNNHQIKQQNIPSTQNMNQLQQSSFTYFNPDGIFQNNQNGLQEMMSNNSQLQMQNKQNCSISGILGIQNHNFDSSSISNNNNNIHLAGDISSDNQLPIGLVDLSMVNKKSKSKIQRKKSQNQNSSLNNHSFQTAQAQSISQNYQMPSISSANQNMQQASTSVVPQVSSSQNIQMSTPQLHPSFGMSPQTPFSNTPHFSEGSLILDAYKGWGETAGFQMTTAASNNNNLANGNQSQYTFNQLYSPKQCAFHQYSDSPSMSTMNASPGITPFLNPFAMNSPSISSAQNNYASAFLSPLNLSMNSSFAPLKSSHFSLNQTDEILKKSQTMMNDQKYGKKNNSQQHQNQTTSFY